MTGSECRAVTPIFLFMWNKNLGEKNETDFKIFQECSKIPESKSILLSIWFCRAQSSTTYVRCKAIIKLSDVAYSKCSLNTTIKNFLRHNHQNLSNHMVSISHVPGTRFADLSGRTDNFSFSPHYTCWTTFLWEMFSHWKM